MIARVGGVIWRSAAWWLGPAVAMALYWRGLIIWFQQDDFAWLGLGKNVGTFRDLMWAMFAPMAQGTIRPWSERAFFMGFVELFGIDPLPFRITVFATMFANMALVAWLARRLTGSVTAAVFAPALWIANASLVQVMTWTSAFNQALCALFLLAAFTCLLRWIETREPRWWRWQLVAFLLGFGANELNVVYPAIALWYALCCAPDVWRRTLWLFPVSIAYAAVHRAVSPSEVPELYRMHFDFSMFHTLWKYWELAMGPSQLLNIMVPPAWFAPAATAVLSVAFLGFAAVQLWRRKWLTAFLLGWFVIVLGPVLPLRDHVSEYYLTIPLIGLSVFIAWGIAEAWRAHPAWGVLAMAMVTLYVWPNTKVAEKATRWAYVRAKRVEDVVLGVEAARALHPRKPILLAGVDDELFWRAILDRPFRLLGVEDVYLTPESIDKITPHPEFGAVSDFVMPAMATLDGLGSGRIVVYSVEGPRLRNITSVYAQTSRMQLTAEVPRRVDVGNVLLGYLLGREWYSIEGAYRWMPKSATVRIGGPKSAGQNLYVTGYVPAERLDAGPIGFRAWVDGKALPEKQIAKGMERFDFSYELPAGLVGKEAFELRVEVGRIFVPPGDGRELGAAFGVFEVK